ncbi:MAG: hypothetical protein [Caudoviricetes sp.]|nr:MAG: hypothetical protein [Caudoviricetes sp.]
MANQTVNTGNNANDGSGDPARTAFTKINQNFAEVYDALGQNAGTISLAVPVARGGTGTQTPGIPVSKNINCIAADTLATNPTSETDFINALSNLPSIGGTVSINSAWTQFLSIRHRNGYGDGNQFGFIIYSMNMFNLSSNDFYINRQVAGNWGTKALIRTSANTTTDGNGYLKPSSPVVRLYADKIEAINEAVDKGITFEKLGVGDYLVKNTTGLRDDGWYIETPKDANGNILVFVEFTQLDNKDISVKTYKKTFDVDTASIVANHDKPMDIPIDRWIDLRFNDYPVTEQQPTAEATS